MSNEITWEEAAEWLNARDHFLILTHVRPDGDTLGCAGALCAALRKAGKRAALLPNHQVTSTYAGYMESYWAENPADYQNVVAVDVAAEGMFPDNAQAYKGKVGLCIDHHPSNERYAENLCLEADRAACGEILLPICKAIAPLDAEIAQLLYVAVSTDCGCFVYGNTRPHTHRVAAELMEYGTFYQYVNKTCFRTKSFKRLRLESMLVEGMELYQDGYLAVAVVSQEMMRQVNAAEDDAEDLAAFAGQVEGVHVSATIRELEEGKKCKISLRTDYTLDASKTCGLLGGGGHVAAAGVTLDMDIPHAKAAILQAIATVQAEQK